MLVRSSFLENNTPKSHQNVHENSDKTLELLYRVDQQHQQQQESTAKSSHHHWYVDENFVTRAELYAITTIPDRNLNFDTINNIQNNMYFYLVMNDKVQQQVGLHNKKVTKKRIKDDRHWDCIIYEIVARDQNNAFKRENDISASRQQRTVDESTEEETPVFTISFPQLKRKICAHKLVLQSLSGFFDTMLKSEMIECESNEMSIEEDENIVEHVMDFLHLGWTGVYSRELLISLQNTTQFDDESLGYAMIGMSEILQLIEKADEFGIPCLIEAIAQTMNEYNAMIYVKKSLTIIDELRAIIWNHAARIVAENITCVISDHIYDCENYRESGGSWSYPTLDQHIERENNLRSWCERLSITNVVEQLVLFQKNIFIHAITTLPLDFLLKVLKCESFSENTHNVIAYICMWLLQNFTDDNDNSLEQIFQILRSIDLAACSLEFINLFIVRIFMELLKMRGLTELYNNTSSLVIRSALNMLQGTNVRHMINDISETLLNSMLKQFHHHYQNNAENCPSFNEAVLRLWLRNIDRKSWNEFQLVHQDPFNSITSKLLNTIETNHHFKQYTLDLMGACLTHVLEETFPQSSRHPNHSMNKHQIPKTEQLHQKVLLLGLDDSGKTSLLYKLTNKENQDQYSTIGYNAEKALFGPVVLNIWDIGGSLIMRPLWKQFINDCDALIYVIDASNPDRFHEALESLDTYLDYSLLKPGCSFIIYANKMDLVSNKTQRVREIRTIFSEKSKFVSKVEIATGPLNNNTTLLNSLHLQPCSALTGEGISSGLDILCNKFHRHPYQFGEIPHILEYIHVGNDV